MEDGGDRYDSGGEEDERAKEREVMEQEKERLLCGF